MMKRMRVQLLYFDGCPNSQLAEDRLHEALALLDTATSKSAAVLNNAGLDNGGIEVERVLISTPEMAQAWSFHGSPSILVDGLDPFAEPVVGVGLSCRIYSTPSGPGGAPTVSQMVEALAHR